MIVKIIYCITFLLIFLIRNKCEISVKNIDKGPFRNVKFWEESSFNNFYRKNSRKVNKYEKLLLDRESFQFWNDNYHDWTNWTQCSSANCTKSRYRKCKTEISVHERENSHIKTKCLVKYIFERASCNDTEECATGSNSKNDSIYGLPIRCGMKPLDIEHKIYGGNDAPRKSWQWHVGLYFMKNYYSSYRCGGTMINNGWIVTAAHCLNEIAINPITMGIRVINTRKFDFFNTFYVVIGDHDKSVQGENEIYRRISHIIIHPKYETIKLEYDVALLKLEIPVKNYLNFPCIPKSKNFTMDDHPKCYAIGWGYLSSQIPNLDWNLELDFDLERWQRNIKKKTSHILQEVEIPLVELQRCRERHTEFNLNDDIHLCAGNAFKDTCKGDSGGGLFCLDINAGRWYLHGITSFGSSKGCGIGYGVYTKVSKIYPWIKEAIKTNIKF